MHVALTRAVIDDERKYWRTIIESLQAAGVTISRIAQELGVEERQVWRWKSGERIPRGTTALGLHQMHLKQSCAPSGADRGA